MKIVIAGGSGFLGSALLRKLVEARHSVILLSRAPDSVRTKLPPSVQIEQWDAASVGGWAAHIEQADAVINLTGESIAGKRWTAKQKARILSSRINSTRAIVEAIGKAPKKPKALVNQSAVGYYGNVVYGEVTEDHPRGLDFLSDVAEKWEKEALKAEAFGVRVVLPRTGIVLDKSAGALQKMLVPFKLYFGGPLGSGHQWFPWIHLEDEIGALIFAAENHNLRGPVNFAASDSVTMKQFCQALGKAMNRPSWAPVPGFALKILLGEMAESLLLGGQKIVPAKLLEAGYKFHFPKLDEALQNILG
jgi:hypothetical protein